MRVFISHANQDRDFVENLVTSLLEKGIAVFDAHKDIGIGRSITLAIEDAIRESDVILLIISKASSQSRWVFSERAMAIAERENIGKPIIPIRLDPDVEIPFFLKDTATLDIGDRLHPEPGLMRLLDTIQELSAPEVLPSAPEVLERKRMAEQHRINSERLLLEQEMLNFDVARLQRAEQSYRSYITGLWVLFGLLVPLALLLPDASNTKLAFLFAGVFGLFSLGYSGYSFHRIQKAQREQRHQQVKEAVNSISEIAQRRAPRR